MDRKVAAIGGLIAVIALAGCLSVTMEMTVDDDGMVEMEGEMELDAFLFQAMQEEAEEEGYDSFADEMEQDLENDGWNDVEVTIEEGGEFDDAVISFQAGSTDPANLDTISVDVDDDAIHYTETEGFDDVDDGEEDDLDLDFGEEELQESIQMTYIVNMPGEITDTNGEEVDDSTVQWTFADHQGVDTFEVSSQIDADGSPGFTPAIAALVFGLLAISAWAYRRR